MTTTDVQESVVAWASEITGLTAIKGHQSGNRPERPYLMIDVTADREIRDHEADVTFDEPVDTVEATIHVETEWQMSVQCYGDDSMEPLRKLRNRYRMPEAQYSLSPLVIHEIGRINRVPELVQNRWEERAQCNLFIRGMATETAEIDVIEEIEPLELTST